MKSQNYLLMDPASLGVK